MRETRKFWFLCENQTRFSTQIFDTRLCPFTDRSNHSTPAYLVQNPAVGERRRARIGRDTRQRRRRHGGKRRRLGRVHRRKVLCTKIMTMTYLRGESRLKIKTAIQWNEELTGTRNSKK